MDIGTLVVSRFRGERVVIGDPTGNHTTVEIVEVRGNKVRLAITAHKLTPIHREEVVELIYGDRYMPVEKKAMVEYK